MREIKFKAWDKVSKKMYGVTSISWCDGKLFELGLASESRLAFGEQKNLDRFELMQFTGIEDKNKKKIYEGDILKWDGMMNVYSVVVFLDGGFKACDVQSETVIQSRFCEIIGNVFENVTLLDRDKSE